jgi:hypothetical protein
MGDETNEPVVETVSVEEDVLSSPEDRANPVEIVVETSAVLFTPDRVLVVTEETPEEAAKPVAPTDAEVQAALEVVAPGVYFRNRCTLGAATDTFVVGGVFAPGRQRWVQTDTYASAQAQAEAIRDALQ